VGNQVAIRRHRTLDGIFPPTGFKAAGIQSSADEVQVFAGGAWTVYWLYDENDSDPATAHWVDAGVTGTSNKGATVIPPGQGMFFNNRTSEATSLLAYGEVRANDFVQPLRAGYNLVGGGYPVDQSATGTPGGRAMNLADGFFGSRDFKTADSFFVWKGDAAHGTSGYDTYYLLNRETVVPAQIKWVKVGDPNLAPWDTDKLLPGDGSVFIRARNDLHGYTIPSPWNP
jgi:hypothetical protein